MDVLQLSGWLAGDSSRWELLACSSAQSFCQWVTNCSSLGSIPTAPDQPIPRARKRQRMVTPFRGVPEFRYPLATPLALCRHRPHSQSSRSITAERSWPTRSVFAPNSIRLSHWPACGRLLPRSRPKLVWQATLSVPRVSRTRSVDTHLESRNLGRRSPHI